MNGGAEDRGRYRSAWPITLRITALMFLYPDFMIRKDSMEFRLSVSLFNELLTTLFGTNVVASIDQF
jgi:hypothetical protein